MTVVHGLAARYLIGRDDVTTVELAGYLGITKQSTSEVVAPLERAGIVRRAPHPSDGRARVLLLTDDGAAKLGRRPVPLAGHRRRVGGAGRTRPARHRARRARGLPGRRPVPPALGASRSCRSSRGERRGGARRHDRRRSGNGRAAGRLGREPVTGPARVRRRPGRARAPAGAASLRAGRGRCRSGSTRP